MRAGAPREVLVMGLPRAKTGIASMVSPDATLYRGLDDDDDMDRNRDLGGVAAGGRGPGGLASRGTA